MGRLFARRLMRVVSSALSLSYCSAMPEKEPGADWLRRRGSMRKVARRPAAEVVLVALGEVEDDAAAV